MTIELTGPRHHAVLLAIHPRHAAALYAGTKRTEIRSRGINTDNAYLYETGTAGRITGYIGIDRIRYHEATPTGAELEQLLRRANLELPELLTYTRGSGFWEHYVRTIDGPLGQLREAGRFEPHVRWWGTPPQSPRRLTEADLDRIHVETITYGGLSTRQHTGLPIN